VTCNASDAWSSKKPFVVCTEGIRVYARLRYVTVIGGERVNTGLAGRRIFDTEETYVGNIHAALQVSLC
jgi:hypothetical protein